MVNFKGCGGRGRGRSRRKVVGVSVLGVNVVDGLHVSSVVLDSTEGGSTDLTGGVDSVDWLVLGETALVPKLFPTSLTRKYILPFLKSTINLKETLPET